MHSERFMREHRDTVVLGLPDAPVPYLFTLYRKTGNRPYVFAPRFPLWLFLFPFALFYKSATRRQSDVLLMELSDFSDRRRDKYITLIPATEDARLFVRENQSALEADFVIEWTEPAKGGQTA